MSQLWLQKDRIEGRWLPTAAANGFGAMYEYVRKRKQPAAKSADAGRRSEIDVDPDTQHELRATRHVRRHSNTNLMALFARRRMATPADVDAETTRVFKPLASAHVGSVLDVTDETPGAVDATTVEPAARALASTRTNAL
jgi:hypothetical protein